MSRFPFRTPPKDPKAWKTHGFLTSPRWNLETAKATKPCKKRWFLNTTRRIHCKWQGTAPGPANRNRHEVSTRWSAAGAASVYNLRLPPKASGEDTGAGPAPGFKGCRPCRRPRKNRQGSQANWHKNSSVLRTLRLSTFFLCILLWRTT